MDPLDGALEHIADRAEAAWGSGAFARAEALARLGLARDPDHPRLLSVLGALAEADGRSLEAAECFRRAVGRCADDPGLHYNLGVALLSAGLGEAAETAWNTTVALDPDHGGALFNLAKRAADTGRPQRALDFYARARAAAPGNALIAFNQGNLLARLGRLEDAADHLAEACRLAPADGRMRTNLGVVLRRLGRLDAALAAQNAALALAEEQGAEEQGGAASLLLAEVQWNRANLLLALGDYRAGFAGYEWRMRRPAWWLPDPGVPLWRGEPLDGRRLLVSVEQGAGDMIQAARFLPLLAARGAGRVVVEVPQALHRLLAGAAGVDALVEPGGLPEDEPVDCHVRMFSLPHVLGITLEDLPGPGLGSGPDAGAYLRAPAEARAEAPAVDRATGTLAVGLCWSGNPDFEENHVRAAPLQAFASLIADPALRVHSLQKGPPAAQRQTAPAALSDRLTDLGPALTDFAVTAAVMERLDVVVTTDTSVAHLAGALGRPCLLLLAAHCDWRWMTERADSPWYPSLSLFRQERLGEWDPPIHRCLRHLRRLAGQYIPPAAST